MPQHLVERIARAVANAAGSDAWETYQREARAALEAMRDPTVEMVVYFLHRDPENGVPSEILQRWRAMIDAALARSP